MTVPQQQATAADRARARAVVKAYRRYLKTGQLARGVQQCPATHPDDGVRCVLLKRHPLLDHRDGPVHVEGTRTW